jgi:hypothetical protein
VYYKIGLNVIYFKMYDLQNYTKLPQNGRTPFKRKLRKNRGHFFSTKYYGNMMRTL